MPDPRIHDEINLKIFGYSYSEVSKWIDGAFNGANGRTHWIHRHYIQAILEHFNEKDYPNKECRERFIQVAKMHILMDWMFYYKRIVLPLTQQDVVRELQSEGIFV
jgi:hypothetical protein